MNKQQETIREEYRETHPEYHHLKSMKHQGLMTIRFASPSYSSSYNSGESLRKEFCELLMYNIRQKLKIRKLDWEWWGCSEFGKSGTGHCHIIFSFYPMEFRQKPTPNLNGFYGLALESAEHIRQTLGLPRKSIDLHWLPANDQGFVSYFCKKEPGREDYKHFFRFEDWDRLADIIEEELKEEEYEERLRQQATAIISYFTEEIIQSH